MKGLPAATGIEWLKQGFALFRQQPGILLMALLANLLSYAVVGWMPLVGGMIMALLVPSFSMAIMEACNQIAQGKRALPDVILTGFRQPAFAALCRLGLVYVALAIVFLLLSKFNGSEELMRQATQAVDPKKPPVIDGGAALRLLLFSFLQVACIISLAFAAPLTYWKHMPPFKAIFYSFFGVIGALRPILLMIFAWFGMLMAAMLVITLVFKGNMMLAQVVLVWVLLMFSLVLQCAMFMGYRQIFSDPLPSPERANQ